VSWYVIDYISIIIATFREIFSVAEPQRSEIIWGRMSRKLLEIGLEALFQRTTNRIWPMANRRVTWPWPGKVKVMTPICLGSIILITPADTDLVAIVRPDSLLRLWHYINLLQSLTYLYLLTYLGNVYSWIIWSPDRWRNMSLKGQRPGMGSDMFSALFLDNGWPWQYRLSSKRPPTENATGEIKWSCARWCHVTRSLYSELIPYWCAIFRNNKIAWKNRKTANIAHKTAVDHTVNGDVRHIENSKTLKGYITHSSKLTFGISFFSIDYQNESTSTTCILVQPMLFFNPPREYI